MCYWYIVNTIKITDIWFIYISELFLNNWNKYLKYILSIYLKCEPIITYVTVEFLQLVKL